MIFIFLQTPRQVFLLNLLLVRVLFPSTYYLIPRIGAWFRVQLNQVSCFISFLNENFTSFLKKNADFNKGRINDKKALIRASIMKKMTNYHSWITFFFSVILKTSDTYKYIDLICLQLYTNENTPTVSVENRNKSWLYTTLMSLYW